MEKVRVMHFVNQFFAGLGGEDRADLAVGSIAGPAGPGRLLQTMLGESAQIVVTAYCGDNYFAEHREEALARILAVARDHRIQIAVAGPAFLSGRYGFTCVEVCRHLGESLDIPSVTALHPENPALNAYRQYKDRRVFALPTSESVTGMAEAVSRLARLAGKIAVGEVIGPAAEEGYIPRGIRVTEPVSRSGRRRAIDMLLGKIAGSFQTEIPVEIPERVSIAPPIADLKKARLALVSTSGVIARGNPDGFKTGRNTHWKKYSIAGLNSMKEKEWDVIHGGYNITFMCDNPNYGVPLDACRELERAGAFGQLASHFYATVGVQALVSAMQKIGREIVMDMRGGGVDGAILVST